MRDLNIFGSMVGLERISGLVRKVVDIQVDPREVAVKAHLDRLNVLEEEYQRELVDRDRIVDRISRLLNLQKQIFDEQIRPLDRKRKLVLFRSYELSLPPTRF